MHAAYQGLNPQLTSQLWTLIQVVAVAELAGWTAERLLDPGFRARGFTLLCGLIGAYAGRALASLAELPAGPSIAGFPVLAAFVGALGVSGVLKLVTLGASGPRW